MAAIRLKNLSPLFLSIVFLFACNRHNQERISGKNIETNKEQPGITVSKQEIPGEENKNLLQQFEGMPDELVTDPNEHAFTIRMPAGWKNEAWIYRVDDLTRSVATSVSPDGKTVIFIGDPKMPNYFIPTPNFNENSLRGIAMNPLTRFADFMPAETYLTGYIKEKFGSLEGFQLIDKEPAPLYGELVQAQLQREAIRGSITDAAVKFDYTLNGEIVHALLNCTTVNLGTLWMVNVNGISSSNDPAQYNNIVVKMIRSHQPDQAWTQQQKQQQEEKRAMNDYNHQQVMAGIQANTNAMTQRHNMRMNALHSANESYNQAWQQQQASNEQRHGQFLNMIRDEHTVTNSSGQTFQVDNSYQKYYINKNDNSYIGTSSTANIDDLRKLGVEPGDYEEVSIIR